MTSNDQQDGKNDQEADAQRRRYIETQRSDEAGRQDRFSRWDHLQDESRARAASSSSGTPEQDQVEVSPEDPEETDKRSQLVIRLEKAKEALKRSGRPDPSDDPDDDAAD